MARDYFGDIKTKKLREEREREMARDRLLKQVKAKKEKDLMMFKQRVREAKEKEKITQNVNRERLREAKEKELRNRERREQFLKKTKAIERLDKAPQRKRIKAKNYFRGNDHLFR